MQLVKIISTRIFETLRLIKVQRYGKDDIQEPIESSPFGIDGNPFVDVPDKDKMVAVYSSTDIKGEAVLIGYLNKNRLAAAGELRQYSTDANGNEQFYTWLKNDGTLEIGGDTDNMVRYSELKSAFDELKGTLNTLITQYNLHQHFYVNAAGSPTATTPLVPPLPPINNSTADISGAKIDEIKTL